MFRSNGPATFDKLLEKATIHTNLEPDINSIIQISDLIRQNDCPPKYALAAIKKKLLNTNAHTVNYALLVLESIVKNCGHVIHDEIATKSFMENLRDVLKFTTDEAVKQKTLEMIQAWAWAFRSTPKYKPVQDMANALKADGVTFPPLKESDAMFSAESAPEWVDSDNCHRCRVQFGLLQRKHHCRSCGNVFCQSCSGKSSNIPKYGIEKEVRVCDTCYEQNKNQAASPKVETEQLPVEYLSSSLAQQKQAPKQKSAEELKEEEEFQLALALSQSEAEAKEHEKKRPMSDLNNAFQSAKITSPVKKEEDDPDDEELARYLNRSHWDQRAADRTKTRSPDRKQNSPPSAPQTPTHQLENGLSDSQLNEFVSHLRSQVDIFVNRMKSNSSRGRSISNDSSVQGLFLNITENHSKLLQFMSQQEELRLHFEGLQDKLAQVKDAVAALDDLRNEHQEKLRMEAEEAERIKQQQMAHKLQIMRKKKQEYLQHQRVLALARVREQELDMQLRKQQQQQYPGGYMMYQQGAGYPGQVPSGYPQPYIQPGYPPTMMHQGMGIPSHMLGPQSLPPQHPQAMMSQQAPGMQQQGMAPQPQTSGSIPMHQQYLQNPGYNPQGMPGMMPQAPGPQNLQSPMENLPQGMQAIHAGMGQNPVVGMPAGIPQNPGLEMQNPGGIGQNSGPVMQNPGGMGQNSVPGMQNPGNMAPNHGMAQNPGAGMGMPHMGQPQMQGVMPHQMPHGNMHPPHSMPMQHQPYGMPGGQQVPPQHGGMAGLPYQQPQQPPQQRPHPEESTAELISFD